MLMSSYLLHGELQKVIIHVGTTNAMTYTPKEILKKNGAFCLIIGLLKITTRPYFLMKSSSP